MCGPHGSATEAADKASKGSRHRQRDDERAGGASVALALRRTPRGIYAHQHAHYASKIRPGPGIPPGYIVPIAKRSPPHRLRASFHAFHVDPIALWGSASRSSIFLGRIDPRVLLTAKGGEREQRDARSAHAGA